MVKRNLFAVLTLAFLCFGTSLNSYASETVDYIEVDSESDIPEPHYSENESYGLKKIYVIKPSENQTRAICYNCGKAGMTSISEVEEWGPTPIPCPAADQAMNSDFMYEYKYYNGEKHAACGLYARAYWKSVYKVQCQNGDDLGLNNTWYTIGQGTNIHCLIDPENPTKHPYD